MLRANEAAAAADTIIVRPDSLLLRIGDELFLWNVLTIEARTSAGTRVEGFAPLIEVADNSIVAYSGMKLAALRPGLTTLIVRGHSLDPKVPASAARATVSLRVLSP